MTRNASTSSITEISEVKSMIRFGKLISTTLCERGMMMSSIVRQRISTVSLEPFTVTTDFVNVRLGMPIIVIGDLGFWHGRRQGYKEIQSGNVADCLNSDTDYSTWYVDELGDLRCDAVHHDGTNLYTHRAFKAGTTDDQMENLKWKLYKGIATRKDITRYTERLGDAIANIYGFSIRKKQRKKVA